MKQRFALICAVALLASTQSNPAPAESRAATAVVPDIKGLKLNATQADVQARFPTVDCGPTSNGLILCHLDKVAYGGSTSSLLTIYLDGGCVKAIHLDFLDASEFGYMMLGLRTKFGPADERVPGRPTWRGKNWELLVQKSQGPQNRPSIRLMDTAWLASREQLRAQQAAKSLD